MLVDVVTEFAAEVVRPAAADANEACPAPAEVLEAGHEIGLPILGVPEELGGISDERSAMAGTLVPKRSPTATSASPSPRWRPARSPPRSALGHRRAAGDLPAGVHRDGDRCRPRPSR